MAIASDGYILGANRTRLGFEASGWRCDAVRYVLPSKPKRKDRKGVQACGCDINTDGAHQHGCRSGGRKARILSMGGVPRIEDIDAAKTNIVDRAVAHALRVKGAR